MTVEHLLQNCPTHQNLPAETLGRYHGGQRPSSDDSLHSLIVIPPSALDKRSITKSYHRRQTCSHTSPRRSPTMVKIHDTRFVECRWWNDGWTVKTVVTRRSSASMIRAPWPVDTPGRENQSLQWSCKTLVLSVSQVACIARRVVEPQAFLTRDKTVNVIHNHEPQTAASNLNERALQLLLTHVRYTKGGGGGGWGGGGRR